MILGLDGIEVGLLIVFMCLFGGIMSGFPVAFAIGGAGIISFGIIAALDSAGILIHQAIDSGSAEYGALVADGIARDAISVFRYPELPRVEEALFPGGWELAVDRNLSFIVNRMNERVIAGASIETLLAVAMFVMMGITLERSKIANDLLTTMARLFGPLPGGLAVSIVIVGAFLAASTGIVGATVVTMGLLALPTMLRNGYSPELSTGVIAASGTLGQIIPPSIVIVLLGTLAGDLYSTAQEQRAQFVGCGDALTYLGKPAVVSVGTLFQAALLPGIMLAFLYAAYAFGFALLNPSKAPPVIFADDKPSLITRSDALTWFLFAPVGIIVAVVIAVQAGIVGSQSVQVSAFSASGETASLRTNVSEQCSAAMIDLHGQEAWDMAVAEQAEIEASGGVVASRELTTEERDVLRQEVVARDWLGHRDIVHPFGLGPDDCAGCEPYGVTCAADCGRPWRCACLCHRHRTAWPADILWDNVCVDGYPLGFGGLWVAHSLWPFGAERIASRGVPAAGVDRGGAWIDPWWYYEPNARCGLGGRWGHHAGRLPQAARGSKIRKMDPDCELLDHYPDHLWREF